MFLKILKSIASDFGMFGNLTQIGELLNAADIDFKNYLVFPNFLEISNILVKSCKGNFK